MQVQLLERKLGNDHIHLLAVDDGNGNVNMADFILPDSFSPSPPFPKENFPTYVGT